MIFMGRTKFSFAQNFTPVQQAFIVCATYPGFSYRVTGRNQVSITGKLKPSALHGEYEVEISYTLGRFPKAKIISPKIIPKAPHTFDDDSICTFYPESFIWNRSMKLSETLVPWISDWIFHYEIWKVTGKWNGDADPRHPRRMANVS